MIKSTFFEYLLLSGDYAAAVREKLQEDKEKKVTMKVSLEKEMATHSSTLA